MTATQHQTPGEPMKTVDFDAALDDAIAQLRAGVPLEECLATRPALAADLRPLLEMAQLTLRVAPASPPPGAKARVRGVVLAAAEAKLARPRGWGHSWLRGLRLQPLGCAVASAVAALALAGGSTLVASASSLPGQPLYPLKLATEDTRLAVARLVADPAAQAQLHAEIADRRVAEVKTLADQGKPVPPDLVEAAAKQAVAADAAVAQLPEPKRAQAAAQLETAQAQRNETLARVENRVSAPAQTAIAHVLAAGPIRQVEPTERRGNNERPAEASRGRGNGGADATVPAANSAAASPAARATNVPQAASPTVVATTATAGERGDDHGTDARGNDGRETGRGNGPANGRDDGDQGRNDARADDRRGEGRDNGPGAGPSNGPGPGRALPAGDAANTPPTGQTGLRDALLAVATAVGPRTGSDTAAVSAGNAGPPGAERANQDRRDDPGQSDGADRNDRVSASPAPPRQGSLGGSGNGQGSNGQGNGAGGDRRGDDRPADDQRRTGDDRNNQDRGNEDRGQADRGRQSGGPPAQPTAPPQVVAPPVAPPPPAQAPATATRAASSPTATAQPSGQRDDRGANGNPGRGNSGDGGDRGNGNSGRGNDDGGRR